MNQCLRFGKCRISPTFRSAVSLHSHTLYSRESLSFVFRAAAQVPLLSRWIRSQEKRYRTFYGSDLDVSRGWWTPPLSPRDALRAEVSQIEDKLQLNSLVSLTDHDTIEGVRLLGVVNPGRVPVSVEWTIPYGESFFHLGIHNLPVAGSQQIFDELAAYTSSPEPRRLRDLMWGLDQFAEILVVFNHPCWDEKGVGQDKHDALVDSFLSSHGEWIHAIELNGLRPWAENRMAARLASDRNYPLISGGDRHGREPNSVLNLTAASQFSEFVEEIRRGRQSQILSMPQYEDSLRLRIVQNIGDILREDDTHSMGWKCWSDRVFYRCEDGEVRSISQLWGKSAPSVVNWCIGLIRLAENRRMRGALRIALAGKQESAI